MLDTPCAVIGKYLCRINALLRNLITLGWSPPLLYNKYIRFGTIISKQLVLSISVIAPSCLVRAWTVAYSWFWRIRSVHCLPFLPPHWKSVMEFVDSAWAIVL